MYPDILPAARGGLRVRSGSRALRPLGGPTRRTTGSPSTGVSPTLVDRDQWFAPSPLPKLVFAGAAARLARRDRTRGEHW